MEAQYFIRPIVPSKMHLRVLIYAMYMSNQRQHRIIMAMFMFDYFITEIRSRKISEN